MFNIFNLFNVTALDNQGFDFMPDWATTRLLVGTDGAGVYGYELDSFGNLNPNFMGANLMHTISVKDELGTTSVWFKVGVNGDEKMIIQGVEQENGFARLGDTSDVLAFNWDAVNLRYSILTADLVLFDYFVENVNKWIPIGGISIDHSLCIKGNQIANHKCTNIDYRDILPPVVDAPIIMSIDMYGAENDDKLQGIMGWCTMWQGGRSTCAVQLGFRNSTGDMYIRYRTTDGSLIMETVPAPSKVGKWANYKVEILPPFLEATFTVTPRDTGIPEVGVHTFTRAFTAWNNQLPRFTVGGSMYLTGNRGYWENIFASTDGITIVDSKCHETFGSVVINGASDYGIIENLTNTTHATRPVDI